MTTERTEATAWASWAGEVIADRSGKFVGNGLRFATKAEAEAYMDDLACRWTLVTQTRVVETIDPVANAYEGGKLTFIPKTEAEAEVEAVRQGGLSAAPDWADTPALY